MLSSVSAKFRAALLPKKSVRSAMSTKEADAHSWNRLSKMGQTAWCLRLLAMVIQICSIVVVVYKNCDCENGFFALPFCVTVAQLATFVGLWFTFDWQFPINYVICVTSAAGCVLNVVILSGFNVPFMTEMQVGLALDLSVLFLCCLTAGLDHRELAKRRVALPEAGSDGSPSPNSSGKQDNNDPSVV